MQYWAHLKWTWVCFPPMCSSGVGLHTLVWEGLSDVAWVQVHTNSTAVQLQEEHNSTVNQPNWRSQPNASCIEGCMQQFFCRRELLNQQHCSTAISSGHLDRPTKSENKQRIWLYKELFNALALSVGSIFSVLLIAMHHCCQTVNELFGNSVCWDAEVLIFGEDSFKEKYY